MGECIATEMRFGSGRKWAKAPVRGDTGYSSSRGTNYMDGGHAGGCSLVGLAATALLIRIFWMSSPPFSTMSKAKVVIWARSLIALAVIMTVGGIWLLAQPEDPSVAMRNAEEGFQFH